MPQAARTDVDNLKAALSAGEGGRGLHERRLARRGVAVLPQRPLQGLRDLHLRHRRRDARRIRDRRQGRHRRCRSTAPTSAWAGTSSTPTSTSRSSASASQLHIEALNHATRNIPPEQLRLHLCWGNYEGPHHYDVPLADIIDIVFPARPRRHLARSRQSAPRPRMHRVRDREAARRQGADPRRDRIEVELHRASRADRAAHRPLCQARRPRERDRRQRLRLRHLGRPGRGRSRRGVGQARRDGRRRAHRHQSNSGTDRPMAAPRSPRPSTSQELATHDGPVDQRASRPGSTASCGRSGRSG